MTDAEASMQAMGIGEPTQRRNRAIDRFMRHRLAVLGIAMIIALALLSFVGPRLLPFNDLYIDIRYRFAPPFESVHLLGTDPLGRDHLARLMMAGRISMSIGFSAMLIATCLGTVDRSRGGLLRRLFLGAALMRQADAPMLCFPSIFLLLAVAAFINPGVASITLIIALTSWMEVARVVEGQMKSLRERDFAVAAELMGGSDRYIIFRELPAQRRPGRSSWRRRSTSPTPS